MKAVPIYILVQESDPLDYNDESTKDSYGSINGVFVTTEELEHTLNKFRQDRYYWLTKRNDDFTKKRLIDEQSLMGRYNYYSDDYYVITIYSNWNNRTGTLIDIDPQEMIRCTGIDDYDCGYKVVPLHDFLKKHNIELWKPDPKEVEEFNSQFVEYNKEKRKLIDQIDTLKRKLNEMENE